MSEIEIEIITLQGSPKDDMLRHMQKNADQVPVMIGPVIFHRVFVTSMDQRPETGKVTFYLSGVTDKG